MFVGQMVFDEMTWSHHDPVFFLGATTEGRKKKYFVRIVFIFFDTIPSPSRVFYSGGAGGGGIFGKKPMEYKTYHRNKII